MSTAIETIDLIYVDVTNNNNKFWRGELFSDDTVKASWGRVGDAGDSGVWSGGKSFLDKKVREKLKKGYTKLEVVGSSTTIASNNSSNLKAIATKQIETQSSITRDLIERLTQYNIHTITSNTNMTYDMSKGTFSTPLGIVSQNSIDRARTILIDMQNAMRIANTNEIERLGAEYLRVIPKKLGRSKTTYSNIFHSMEVLNGEASILDSLETSLIGVTSSGAEIKEEKIFNVKIDLLEDGKEIDRINNFYNSTRQSMHACNHLKIKHIYTVEIGHIKSNYDSNTINENIMELWHGTSKAHLLSILKSGLKIPNGKGAVLNGANFGYGIYMSDQSTKSLNYAYGYWSGTRDNNCFMFLCDAKMGKILYPNTTDGMLHQKLNGHDSVWCKPSNVRTLANNEMIVYKESQCNLKYLCEFTN